MSTEISWTDETWNPTVGCTRVSPGCEKCYAEKMAWRLEFMGHKRVYGGLTTLSIAWGERRWNGTVRLLPERLEQPLHWRKPRRVFVDSMSDLFHESVPYYFIDRVLGVAARCPQHTFQILTKRPERMLAYMNEVENCRGTMLRVRHAAAIDGGVARGLADEPVGVPRAVPTPEIPWPLPNVWLGVSVEDQKRYDERIEDLIATPAAVRFLSVEPMLEGLRLFDTDEGVLRGPCVIVDGGINRVPGEPDDPFDSSYSGIDWIIFGGESGPGARPCNVEWIRDGVRQCKAAGVPAYVKQLGAKPAGLFGKDTCDKCWLGYVDSARGGHGLDCPHEHLKSRKGSDPSEWPEDLRVQEYPG